jgi:CDP-diacylglycerol---serine O-phosphatidyltransferase
MEFNSLDPIGGEERPRSPFGKYHLRRGIYILPSIFTVANLLCGYYAILATVDGKVTDFDNASRAIGLAILFDSLDGRVARMMHTSSEFGKEFDSLADVVSFGLAPAVLAYAWGIRAMAAADSSPALHLIELGWLIGFFFVGCCAWRLARFNIKGMASGGNRYFVGMPTPAGAGMIAAVVHAFRTPIDDTRISLLWLVLVVCLGILMSSTVKHYSFKDIQWTKRQPSLAIVLVALLISGIFLFSGPTLLILASVYTLHGVTLQLVRFVRHRLASRTA